MNLRAVAWLLGCVSLILAAFMIIPAGVALIYGESIGVSACLLSALVSAAVGACLSKLKKKGSLSPKAPICAQVSSKGALPFCECVFQ